MSTMYKSRHNNKNLHDFKNKHHHHFLYVEIKQERREQKNSKNNSNQNHDDDTVNNNNVDIDHFSNLISVETNMRYPSSNNYNKRKSNNVVVGGITTIAIFTVFVITIRLYSSPSSSSLSPSVSSDPSSAGTMNFVQTRALPVQHRIPTTEHVETTFRRNSHRNRRRLQEDDQINCSVAPILHHSPARNDDSLKTMYDQHFLSKEKDRTANSNNDELTMTTFEGPGTTFILWGRAKDENERRSVVTVSAFNDEHHYETGSENLLYVSPYMYRRTHLDQNIDRLKTLEGDHIVFMMSEATEQNYIVSNILPYVAYWKEAFDHHKLLLPTTLRSYIEQFDFAFVNDSEQVSWIDLSEQKNVLVKIQNGSLTVASIPPKKSSSSLQHLQAFRRWFYSSRTTSSSLMPSSSSSSLLPQNDENGYIVYYTTSLINSSNIASSLLSTSFEHHTHSQIRGRQPTMDTKQESLIVRLIQHAMTKYNRPETLVVYDPVSFSIKDCMTLFQNAKIVIGPFGPGLSNLLFLPESKSCEDRPKVLEFITSPQGLMGGSLDESYYQIYNTAPWIEYHHLLYAPQSSSVSLKINLQEFQYTLHSMFSNSSESLSSNIAV